MNLRYEHETEQSPDVHTNIDGEPMNSRRILVENVQTNHASKYLFSSPVEVEITEREVNSSQWSAEGFKNVNYSDHHRTSESMVVPSSADQRINTVREMKIHNTDQTKVMFEQPKICMNKSDTSELASPREESSFSYSLQKETEMLKSKIYENVQRTPKRNMEEKEEVKEDIEVIPVKKYNLQQHMNNIELTDDEKGEKPTPSKPRDERKDTEEDGLHQSW